MARRTRKRRTVKCKNVTICGKKRKLCWSKKGKIVSNRPVGRAAKKSTKRRKKASSRKKMTGGWKRVSRAAAVHKSGKKKGRLKKGCKFVKGDGALCRKGRSTTKRKRRATGSRKKNCRFGVNKNTGACLKHPRGKRTRRSYRR